MNGFTFENCIERMAREIAGDVLADEDRAKPNNREGWAKYRIRNWSRGVQERVQQRAWEILQNGEMKDG